jgi:hypothetical protein
VEILQCIRDWALNDSGGKPIFWLRDIAGSGKSTVAMTVAQELKELNCLGGRFFFSINDKRLSGTKEFCSAIARDLYTFFPDIRSTVVSVAANDPAIPTRSFEEQFQALVIQPLRSITQRVVLVIDAIDECNKQQRKDLLEALVSNILLIPSLRVFFTSRPEPDISSTVKSVAVIRSMEFRLHGTQYRSNVDDIRTYIDYYLERLGPEQREGLVKKANGLFIWASTARDEFELSDEPVESIYRRLTLLDSSDNLDNLYVAILRRALLMERSRGLMCKVLAVLAVTYEPISIQTLEGFIQVDARHLLQRLASVFISGDAEDLIHFRHQTFREFLLRGKCEEFDIDRTFAHGTIATRTFSFLRRLKEDPLGIYEPHSAPIKNWEVAEARSRMACSYGQPTLYCAKFWPHHTSNILDDAKIFKLIEDFIKVKLLNWMEMASWDQHLSFCRDGLLQLRNRLMAIPSQYQIHESVRSI